MTLDAFKPGDRVELVRYYSFWGDAPPQRTVISTSNRRVRCKMDRTGKLIRYFPDGLRHVERSYGGGLGAKAKTIVVRRHNGARRGLKLAMRWADF
jgi:hypothetical protein